jgi:LacI family transcriptional regulator
MDFVDLVSPKLTTVRIRHRDMGLEAARLLLRAMRGEAIGQMELVLRPEFIVRASTGNPPPLL